VDDEDGVRRTMSRLLSRDHDLVMASSGEEACDILEGDRKFDLILCDLMMPKMSGMDLHAWLAQRDGRLASQVVFVTGGAFTPRASEYLNSVDNLRVEKPFDGTNFRKLVAELIRAGRSREAAG
jgi:CheY-like chemotaxis protein